MRIIKHDGFARETLVRHTFKCITESCAWCHSKNARGRLYMYAIVRDDRPGNQFRIDGYFCSVGCMRAYHACVSGWRVNENHQARRRKWGGALMRIIKHDGVARETLVRETVTPFRGVMCTQCGGLSKKGKLYRYAHLRDDRMSVAALRWSKPFCSIGCMRAYGS